MDIEYIKNIIQTILNKEFQKNPSKRVIIEHNDRLNFACPYCGDSAKNNVAKRGNLYLNRLFYVCFNCDKKTSFSKMCKDFDIVIDPDKKIEMNDYIDNNIRYTDYADDFLNAKTVNLINLDRLTKTLNNGSTNITEFKPVVFNSIVYNYLISRGIPQKYHTNIYQAKYWIGNNYQWVICILNRRGDNVLGMQIRNIGYSKNRMFKIYNYETLMKMVSPKKLEEMDEIEIIVFNKLSYFFNIMNINIEKKITIFEGYLDSLFYPNSIGVVGINSDFKFLEDNNLDIQYLFDNDVAEYKKSEEKIRHGYPIFLWKKFIEEIIKITKPHNPYEMINKMSKIKDLNNLAQIVTDPYNKLELDKYFSKDIMDIIYLPNTKKVYKKRQSK